MNLPFMRVNELEEHMREVHLEGLIEDA
jgi:hypothetical protein